MTIANQKDLQSKIDSNDDEEVEYFQSKVQFDPKEREFMIMDLTDLLSRLQEKNVIDFERVKKIMLLDKKGTKIEFKKTEQSEVHRFISLIDKSFSLFNYLIRNLPSLTVTKEVQRNDRIMGSVNLQKTFAIHLRYPNQKNTVVCNEIHKTYYTPENFILTQILFSINIICNRYLSKRGSLDKPTLKNLEYIQNYTINLLSSRIIKDILPFAISNITNYEIYLEIILLRIIQGVLPRYYIGLINILRKWKYFVWISNKNPEPHEHSLRYYFFSLKDKDKLDNKLYECWILYKILDIVSNFFTLKFKSTDYNGITYEFKASSGKIKNIIYQKGYKTGWIKYERSIFDAHDIVKELPILDRPDIVIKFRNKRVIIIDAKNSDLNKTAISEYRPQMDSYIRSIGTEKTYYGIFIFSRGDRNSWKEITKKNQKMIWMSLTPNLNLSKDLNNNTINELIHIIKSI